MGEGASSWNLANTLHVSEEKITLACYRFQAKGIPYFLKGGKDYSRSLLLLFYKLPQDEVS
jgi:hypothetical protein